MWRRMARASCITAQTRANLRYLRTVLRHKWYVFVEGRKLGVPLWRLVIHDWSKFTRSEWGPYVRRFEYGRAGLEDKSNDPEDFKRAWSHHWHHNPHHWEYWAKPEWDGMMLHMPETYAREMIADWRAASRVYSGQSDCLSWYEKNKHRQTMDSATREFVEGILYAD